MASSDDNAASRTADSFRDLRYVVWSIGGTTFAALFVTAWYAIVCNHWAFPLQVLWALALWCAFVGLGFLFGIPKVLQAPQPNNKPAPPAGGSSAATTTSLAYQQRVNTNLEEISDWLTKIVVGVTLVELKSLSPYVKALAEQITSNLGNGKDSCVNE